MTLTPRLDLRGGRDCWRDDPALVPTADPIPGGVFDVAIVGAGVTGAILADRFCALGQRVVVLDRRTPATGSTAASTALVLWAPDVPMVAHIARFGASGAAARWRAVFDAVATLDARVAKLKLDAGWRARPDLYLAGERHDADGLKREVEARRQAGLPSSWIDGAEAFDAFGVQTDAALQSTGAFSADPVALTRGLLANARAAGARLVFPVDVLALEERADEVRLILEGTTVSARRVIMATGYEVGGDRPAGFSLGSSFAIASPPNQPPAWGAQAMIWEASDPYLYLRTTPDARIVIGGADEDFADPQRRDVLIPAKARALLAQAQKRLELGAFEIDCAWAATFGASDDGLPAIGLKAGHTRTFVAESFGGNGIAFAALAADILVKLMSDEASPIPDLFRPDRFARASAA